MNARANENALARGASQGIEGGKQTTDASNLAHPLSPAKKLTVLRAIGSQVLAKIWVGSKNGQPVIQQFDEPRNFAVEPSPTVHNIDDLARELDRLASMRHHCVIRGEFVGEDRAQPQEYPGYHRRLKVNFEEVPRHWVMFDVDGFEDRSWSATRDDPVPQIEKFIRKVLPECFWDVTYYWRLSGSAGKLGHESLLKAHIWFWLATPYDGLQLLAWRQLRAIAVDEAVFRTVQIHYTADPIFNGLEDPIKVRGGLVPHAFDEAALVLPDGILDTAQRLRARQTTVAETQLADPSAKPGPIGAFHRAFTVEDVLERWLSDVFDYEYPGELVRLDFLQSASGTKGGAFITYDRMHIGNTHNSDPFRGVATNLFDLVRHYRFGHLDDPDDPFDADPTKSPSYMAALDMIKSLPEVQAELNKMEEERKAAEAEAAKQAVEEFLEQPLEELKKHWPQQAAALTTAEAQLAFRKEVVSRIGITVTEYNAIVKEARRELNRVEAQARADRHAAGRQRLLYEPDREGMQAAEVEKLICGYVLGNDREHEYFIFGGRPSRVIKDVLPETHAPGVKDGRPPAVPRIAQYQDATLQTLCEQVVVFERMDQMGHPTAIRIPQGVKDIMLNRDDHTCATQVTGLLTHPIVTPDGEILNREGLHPESRLLQFGAPVTGCRPYTQAEAREAVQRLKRDFLEGFEFESDLDAIAALGFLLTAVQRRVLDMAPGFAIIATNQSSGKTTLARRTHVILSQQDMPVTSFPKREEEMQKTLLSLLLASPVMVCLDNIPDGYTFRSAPMAAVLTSSTYKQRILGASREVSVPTNTTFVITGNNLQLGRDEDVRLLTVRLDTRRADPEKRKFANPDVVAHARTIRDAVLRDVIGIVAGGLRAAPALPSGSRFQRWDKMVRRPLAWAADVDLAAVFDRNRESSVERNETAGILSAIHSVMGDRWFGAKQLLDALDLFEPEEQSQDRRDLADRLAPFLLTKVGNPIQNGQAKARALSTLLTRLPRDELSGDVEYRLDVRMNTDRKANDFRVVARSIDPFS